MKFAAWFWVGHTPAFGPGSSSRVSKWGEEVTGAPGVHVHLWPRCHCGGVEQQSTGQPQALSAAQHFVAVKT